MKYKKIALSILTNSKVKSVWTLLVILAASIYAYYKWEYVVGIVQTFRISTVLLSFLLILSAKLLLAHNQRLAQKGNSITLDFLDHFYIYNFTQLAKYIPGVIWQFVGKAGEYAKRGLEATHIKNTLMTEIFFLVVGSGFAGVIFISLQQILFTQYGWYAVLALCVLFVLFVFSRKKIKRNFYEKLTVQFFVMHIGIWTLLGASFYLLVGQFAAKMSFEFFLTVLSYNTFSFLVGYVAFFAPGGLGVREAVLVLFMSSEGTQYIITVAAMHRVLYLGVEVLLFFIANFHKEIRRLFK